MLGTICLSGISTLCHMRGPSAISAQFAFSRLATLELPGIGHRIKSIGNRLKNSYPDT